MGKIYSAETIAKWIINEIHPDPLKLQKLLYLAQGYSYAFNDRPLFKEDIEGWVHGPVVPDVFQEYKSYQYNPINISYEVEELDDDALDVLKYVLDKYGKYDAKYLEELAHNQEPWLFSREGLDPDERSDKTISKESISNYFVSDLFQPEDEEWD